MPGTPRRRKLAAALAALLAAPLAAPVPNGAVLADRPGGGWSGMWLSGESSTVTASRTPASAMAASVSAIHGFQLRMPT